jgi:hypothetical protein
MLSAEYGSEYPTSCPKRRSVEERSLLRRFVGKRSDGRAPAEIRLYRDRSAPKSSGRPAELDGGHTGQDVVILMPQRQAVVSIVSTARHMFRIARNLPIFGGGSRNRNPQTTDASRRS